VTGALDIGRRHASHSFDDDYVQNLRHMLFLRVSLPLLRCIIVIYIQTMITLAQFFAADSHRRIYRRLNPCEAAALFAFAFYRAHR
jgi:hypothetical protein